jgi:hypothetical protein
MTGSQESLDPTWNTILSRIRSQLSDDIQASKDLLALKKRLEMFAHYPSDAKQIEKLSKFSTNPKLVQSVVASLGACSDAEITDRGMTFWGLMAFLFACRSNHSIALTQIGQFADTVIKNDRVGFMFLLKRLCDSTKGEPNIDKIGAALESALEVSTDRLPAKQWLQIVGLNVPIEPEWQIWFELCTHRFPFAASPNDDAMTVFVVVRNSPLEINNNQLIVEVHCKALDGPLGGVSDNYKTGVCELSLRKGEYMHTLPTPTPLTLGKMFQDIEQFYGVRFRRDNVSRYSVFGIKQKDAKQRLLSWIASLD